MKKLKNQKAITLIALIITIIVLLILAGVTINMLFGESGILKYSKTAEEKTKQAQITEEIELTITEIIMANIKEGEKNSKEKIAQGLEEKLENLVIREITDEEIKLDYKGYEFVIEKDNKTTIVGKSGIYVTYKLEPEEYTTGEITITLSIETAEGASIESITAETEGMETIEEGVKYKVTENGAYVLKIVDNSGNERKYTILVNKIDNKGPEAQIEILTKNNYINGKIKANVTVTDEGSGVNLTNCKWVINQGSETIGTDASLYTGGDITSETQEIETSKITTAGDYYIHVLTTDNLGNVKETISEIITVKNGYAISTPDDLQNMKNNLAGHYYVVNDINMAGYNFTTIAGSFTGSLDGQGHTISNLTISNTSTLGTGIFYGLAGSASISNLLLKNVNISSSKSYVGTIASHVADASRVKFTKVGITGSVKCTGTYRVASFVCTSDSTLTFENCYARTTLSAVGGFDVGGFYYVMNEESTAILKNCYWSGTINATGRTGPFRGGYSISNNSNQRTGGISLTNCFYNKTLFTLSVPTATAGTGLTTDKMQLQESYTGWDFENTWYMGEDGYPELKF